MDIQLSKQCPECHGYKTVCEEPDWRTEQCPACLGVGEVPTEAGEELIKFLNTFKWMLEVNQ